MTDWHAWHETYAPEEWRFAVGCHRLIAEPDAFALGLRLFSFFGDERTS